MIFEFKSLEACANNNSKTPDVIDNSDILSDGKLKKSLVEQEHYIVMPAALWKDLVFL